MTESASPARRRHRSRPGRARRCVPPHHAGPSREGVRGRRDGRRPCPQMGPCPPFAVGIQHGSGGPSAPRAPWQREPPGQAIPTGSELYDAYLKPSLETPPMAAVIETCAAVRAITRQGADKVLSRDRGTRPFVLEVSDGGARSAGPGAGRHRRIGHLEPPEPAWRRRDPAEGEAEHADRIAYGIPDVLERDRETYAAKSVLVVGGGHSAANLLVDLAHLAEREPRTLIAWATRGSSMMQVYGGGRADQLPARGELGSRPRGPGRGRAPHPDFRLRRGGSGRPAARSPLPARRRTADANSARSTASSSPRASGPTSPASSGSISTRGWRAREPSAP